MGVASIAMIGYNHMVMDHDLSFDFRESTELEL